MAWKIPCIPARPVDVYTVRIFDPDTQPALLQMLKRAVESGGGTFMVELVENRGFIFSIPLQTPNPLSNFWHARWLEEGCIRISKTTLKTPVASPRCHRLDWASEALDEHESDGGDDEGGLESEEDESEHPNARMRWTWSERESRDHTERV